MSFHQHITEENGESVAYPNQHRSSISYSNNDNDEGRQEGESEEYKERPGALTYGADIMDAIQGISKFIPSRNYSIEDVKMGKDGKPCLSLSYRDKGYIYTRSYKRSDFKKHNEKDYAGLAVLKAYERYDEAKRLSKKLAKSDPAKFKAQKERLEAAKATLKNAKQNWLAEMSLRFLVVSLPKELKGLEDDLFKLKKAKDAILMTNQEGVNSNYPKLTKRLYKFLEKEGYGGLFPQLQHKESTYRQESKVFESKKAEIENDLEKAMRDTKAQCNRDYINEIQNVPLKIKQAESAVEKAKQAMQKAEGRYKTAKSSYYQRTKSSDAYKRAEKIYHDNEKEIEDKAKMSFEKLYCDLSLLAKGGWGFSNEYKAARKRVKETPNGELLLKELKKTEKFIQSRVKNERIQIERQHELSTSGAMSDADKKHLDQHIRDFEKALRDNDKTRSELWNSYRSEYLKENPVESPAEINLDYDKNAMDQSDIDVKQAYSKAKEAYKKAEENYHQAKELGDSKRIMERYKSKLSNTNLKLQKKARQEILLFRKQCMKNGSMMSEQQIYEALQSDATAILEQNIKKVQAQHDTLTYFKKNAPNMRKLINKDSGDYLEKEKQNSKNRLKSLYNKHKQSQPNANKNNNKAKLTKLKQQHLDSLKVCKNKFDETMNKMRIKPSAPPEEYSNDENVNQQLQEEGYSSDQDNGEFDGLEMLKGNDNNQFSFSQEAKLPLSTDIGDVSEQKFLPSIIKDDGNVNHVQDNNVNEYYPNLRKKSIDIVVDEEDNLSFEDKNDDALDLAPLLDKDQYNRDHNAPPIAAYGMMTDNGAELHGQEEEEKIDYPVQPPQPRSHIGNKSYQDHYYNDNYNNGNDQNSNQKKNSVDAKLDTSVDNEKPKKPKKLKKPLAADSTANLLAQQKRVDLGPEYEEMLKESNRAIQEFKDKNKKNKQNKPMSLNSNNMYSPKKDKKKEKKEKKEKKVAAMIIG